MGNSPSINLEVCYGALLLFIWVFPCWLSQESIFTHIFLHNLFTKGKIKHHCTFLLSCALGYCRCYSLVSVDDGVRDDGDVAGGVLRDVRVHTVLLVVWRGSRSIRLKPHVVIDLTMCLQVQDKYVRMKNCTKMEGPLMFVKIVGEKRQYKRTKRNDRTYFGVWNWTYLVIIHN